MKDLSKVFLSGEELQFARVGKSRSLVFFPAYPNLIGQTVSQSTTR